MKRTVLNPITFSIRGGEFDPLWAALDEKLKQKTLQEIAREQAEQEPLFAKIRQEGARREIPLVVQTVKAFADGRIYLKDRRIIADGKPLAGPYCLNDDIKRELAQQG